MFALSKGEKEYLEAHQRWKENPTSENEEKCKRLAKNMFGAYAASRRRRAAILESIALAISAISLIFAIGSLVH